MLTRTRCKLISAVAAFMAAVVLSGAATMLHRSMPSSVAGNVASVVLSVLTVLLVMIGFNAVCDRLERRADSASSLAKLQLQDGPREYVFRGRTSARLNGAAYVNGHANANGHSQRREASVQPTISITQRREPVTSELSGAKRWVGQ